MPAQLNNLNLPSGVSVSTSNAFSSLASTSTSTQASTDELEYTQHQLLSLRLIDLILERDETGLIEKLVVEEKVECWISDETQGWTSLHAAAYVGNVGLCKMLLRKGNAVWNLVDSLGCSAGDIAYSMNHDKVYKFLLEEGTRAEMLRAVLEDSQSQDRDQDQSTSTDVEDEETPIDVEGESKPDQEPEPEQDLSMHSKPSTASSLHHYLSQPLTYTVDTSGQPICLDSEGNGVMMGWERGIMERTVEEMLSRGWGDRKGKTRETLLSEEEGERSPLRVVNVGFGLGIIDTFFQAYSPTTHLIIEPHPSVLAHMEQTGWFSKPGVKVFRGTWQDWIAALESGDEEWVEWDGIYFDTYSEHYIDLRRFLSHTPNLLSSSSPSNLASVSFFHGLGATSRNFYDIYTLVSQLHLQEFGLKTEWSEVEVMEGRDGEEDVWEATKERTEEEGGKGEKKKYWEWAKAVGRYRVPVCRLEY
ncbi:protein-arginine N5-methyltransferase [Sporobolomyces salmoneus]|uniref:protein-arginine N5-methyltransferase n=1 Tax=Sporobolomyces salmoneus TaxID=183962 RepID=UPI00317B2EF9